MPEPVHGHEIITLIHELQPITFGQLRRTVDQRYGDAGFHACAGGEMTLEQLLAFLQQRGKVVERDGRYYGQVHLMCDHDG